MTFNQEIATTALRSEAAKAFSDASYKIKFENAGIEEVRECVKRGLQALEMSLPVVESNCVRVRG